MKTCHNDNCNTQSIGDAFEGRCDPFKAGCRATLGMTILSMLSMIVALILAICVIFNMPKFKKIVVGAIGVALLFMFIAWPIGFALRTSIKCNDHKISDDPNSKTGASPPLLMISFFVLVASIVFWVIIKETDADNGGSVNEPTGNNASSSQSTTTTTTTTTTTYKSQTASSLY